MRVLLTGATGYVGRRLMLRLAEEPGLDLRVFVRTPAKLGALPNDRVEVAAGDVFDRASLDRALRGVDAAYYLIHSLGAKGNLEDLERRSAETFREACIEAGVGRVIYLGGLGEKATASAHLRSRLETGEVLSARPDRMNVLWFRAGVVIGSGSASFEMIRNLVQKLPVMITPRWVGTRTQAIGIEDVLAYLRAGLDVEIHGRTIVDIGADVLSFRGMLVGAAKVMGLRRRLIPVPLLTPRLSSYWLVLMTPVPFRIARQLVEGLKSETVALNDAAARLFPGSRPAPYEKAFASALAEIEHRQVVSRWCDSDAAGTCVLDDPDPTARAVYKDERSIDFAPLDSEAVFRSVLSIGGRGGWLAYGWMWRLRGFWDKLTGGPGLGRGRRDPESLRPGDVVDLWRVVEIRPGRRLLLGAEMKLPGRAWLEYVVEGSVLRQTAHFWPHGLGGRVYWWAFKPAHALIFPRLLRKLVARAGHAARP
jgi:uncharacterized protein YbjT (DUF2867 family)